MLPSICILRDSRGREGRSLLVRVYHQTLRHFESTQVTPW